MGKKLGKLPDMFLNFGTNLQDHLFGEKSQRANLFGLASSREMGLRLAGEDLTNNPFRKLQAKALPLKEQPAFEAVARKSLSSLSQ